VRLQSGITYLPRRKDRLTAKAQECPHPKEPRKVAAAQKRFGRTEARKARSRKPKDDLLRPVETRQLAELTPDRSGGSGLCGQTAIVVMRPRPATCRYGPKSHHLPAREQTISARMDKLT